jgi:dipeptidase
MCDTMAALAGATATGHALLAKNSDRERNEAQFLEMIPARDYGAGARLRATYVAIPQARRTHAVLLSRPFWIWGAEMGANEHGVAIGNEAVHPRLTPQRKPALIGMDLLRLGLERGATAREALGVITALLEEFGQGGNCSHLARRWYDNSFIIADAREAFVLETVGRHWAAEEISGARAISNTYTIGTRRSAESAGLRAFVKAQGWWSGRGALDFATAVTSRTNPGLPGALARCGRSTERFARGNGHIDALAMMANLRDHGAAAEGRADFHPQELTGPTVCMHAGDGKRMGQSVGSLVSDLRPGGAAHWVTGASAPCAAIFRPVFLDAPLPAQGPIPGDGDDRSTRWWAHEALHRGALAGDYAGFMADFAGARDALEARFAARVEDAITASGRTGAAARARLAVACWREADREEARWHARLPRFAAFAVRPAYRRSWARFDALARAAAGGA